jgi:hypothetical protein
MAFQSPKKEYPKVATLKHHEMVRMGRPLLVTIKDSRWVDKQSAYVVDLILNSALHNYWTENREIAEDFKKHIGQQVCIIAGGNKKQNSDTMQFQPAGIPASSLPPVNPIGPRPEVIVESKPAAFKTVTTQYGSQSAPQPPQKAPQSVVEAAKTPEREAKRFLCQAANLMRLCVKKANDIAVELNLPEQHRQGIATTLFIQADRQGHIPAMPIDPYKPEQLGFGASKAESLKNPEPSNE